LIYPRFKPDLHVNYTRFTRVQILMSYVLMNVAMAVLLEEFQTASQHARHQASGGRGRGAM
jgi:hypothetical protein